MSNIYRNGQKYSPCLWSCATGQKRLKYLLVHREKAEWSATLKTSFICVFGLRCSVDSSPSSQGMFLHIIHYYLTQNRTKTQHQPPSPLPLKPPPPVLLPLNEPIQLEFFATQEQHFSLSPLEMFVLQALRPPSYMKGDSFSFNGFTSCFIWDSVRQIEVKQMSSFKVNIVLLIHIIWWSRPEYFLCKIACTF